MSETLPTIAERMMRVEVQVQEARRQQDEFQRRTDQRLDEGLQNDRTIMARQEDARIEMAKWDSARDTLIRVGAALAALIAMIAGLIGWLLHWFWPTKA